MNDSLAAPESAVVTPPVAGRKPREEVVHGDLRRDDYFWLREKSDPDVAAYLEAENAYTAAVMKPTEPFQEALYREMLGRIKETDLSVPYREGGFFYYSRTEEGKQYPILCRKKGSLDAPEQITLDLNELAQGHRFLSVGAYVVSDDGTHLAYSTDVTGFREYTLFVKDLVTGALRPERIERSGSVAWAADGRHLFYTIEDHAKRPWQAFRHSLDGTEPDALVYEEKDEMFRVFLGRSRSRAYLFLGTGSHTTTEFRFLRADQPAGEWRLVAERRHRQPEDRRSWTGRAAGPTADGVGGPRQPVGHRELQRDAARSDAQETARQARLRSDRFQALPGLPIDRRMKVRPAACRGECRFLPRRSAPGCSGT